MKSIQALREQRQQLAAKLREIMDSTQDAKWSADNQNEYDSIVAQVDSVDAEIERVEKALEIENASSQRVENRVASQGISADEAASKINMETSVFNTFLREGKEGLNSEQRQYVQNRIQNAQSTGVGSQGGFVVPTDFATTLIEELKAFGGVRSVANVMSTASGNPMQFPTVDDTANEGELVAENAAVSSQDLAFGTKNVGAYKFSSKSIAVPFELLQDNNVNLEAYILNALSTRIARITNRMFTVGTGTGQPEGVVTAAGTGVTAATATGIAYDDFVNLEHSVDPAHRQNGGTLMFNDNTLLAYRKLKDADGRPLWQPSLTAGEPDRIGRYGYVINQNMDDIGASNVSTVFGNFSNYMVRDVMDVMLFRMTDSKYTELGQVGFLAFSRHDGKLLDATGATIKKLTH